MFELKQLSREGVEAALQKVERYRLLNEPWEAESICLDILEVDPDNRDALVALLLSRTDQFGSERGATIADARAVLPRLKDEYARLYYSGIICERQAGVFLDRNATDDGPIAYDWLRKAMDWYERAEAVRPPSNYDSVLRWNTCARTIERHPHVKPQPETTTPVFLE